MKSISKQVGSVIKSGELTEEIEIAEEREVQGERGGRDHGLIVAD